MKLGLRRLSTLAFGMVLCTVYAMANTTAATAGTSSLGSGSIEVTVAATGEVLTLPANWQSLKPEELAQYGLVPNMPAPDGGDVASGAAAAIGYDGTGEGSGVGINSAYIWDGAVFIGVTGTGRHVQEWYTQTAPSALYVCTFATYWVDVNVIWGTGPEECGGPNRIFWASYGPVQFPRDVTICNTWVAFGGKPCVRVWA